MSLSNSLGLLGRKVGMMRLFTDDGDAVPVTVVDVSNNRVTQVKTQENDGYVALQVTFGSRKASRVTKPQAGHLAKAGVEAGEIIQEFRVTAETAGKYAAGADGARQPTCSPWARRSTCRAPPSARASPARSSATTSSSQRASHGNSRSHNVPGSIGMAQDPGPRVPGQAHDGPPGRRHRHHPEPRRVPHRRSAPAAADQGRGPRLQGRFRHRPPGRQGQAAAGAAATPKGAK